VSYYAGCLNKKLRVGSFIATHVEMKDLTAQIILTIFVYFTSVLAKPDKTVSSLIIEFQ